MVGGGFAEVNPDGLTVLAELAVPVEDFDREVLAGQITPGRLGQFILYAVLAGSALGSLSEIGGEVAQASGAAERLFEILAIRPAIAAPTHPLALPSPARGEAAFADVHFSYPTRPSVSALNGISFAVRPGEKVAAQMEPSDPDAIDVDAVEEEAADGPSNGNGNGSGASPARRKRKRRD